MLPVAVQIGKPSAVDLEDLASDSQARSRQCIPQSDCGLKGGWGCPEASQIRPGADLGQNRSNMASPGFGRVLKRFLDALGSILATYQSERSHLDALGSILAKYQPERSHVDPFQIDAYNLLSCFCFLFL